MRTSQIEVCLQILWGPFSGKFESTANELGQEGSGNKNSKIQNEMQNYIKIAINE